MPDPIRYALLIALTACCAGELPSELRRYSADAQADSQRDSAPSDAAQDVSLSWDAQATRSDAYVADAYTSDAQRPVMDATVPDAMTCGVCVPGKVEEQGCNCGLGTRRRICTRQCAWSSWSDCAGGCAPGSTQQQSCNCDLGSRSRTCSNSCRWGNWASCSGGCAPGTTQTRSCDCGSGSRSRSCTNSCTWPRYSACQGGDGYPVRASDPSRKVCPPYDRPAVFFSPHPDDESLGMGGAIAEHAAVGRSTFIELMTRGRATGVRNVLSDGGSHSWHSGSHTYTLSPDQIGDARVDEFLRAAVALGVDGVYVNDFGDGNLTTSEVHTRIRFWTKGGYSGLSLKGTGGNDDPTTAGGSPHRDHKAVWDALIASGFGDIRGYLVYHFTSGGGRYDREVQLSGSYCSAKRTALGAYKVWQPGSRRYAIGYHSVAKLFDVASSSCKEYVIVVP